MTRIGSRARSSSSSSSSARSRSSNASSDGLGGPAARTPGRTTATSRANSSSSMVSPGSSRLFASASSSSSELKPGISSRERQGQALGDGGNVVPLVVLLRFHIDADLEQRRIQGHDDERVETGGSENVGGGRSRIGPADGDDPTIGERHGERQLGGDGDPRQSVVTVEVDPEDLGRCRGCGRSGGVQRLEPAAGAQRDPAEAQDPLARLSQLGDRRRIEPLAIASLQPARPTSLHRPSRRRVNPRRRPAPREMNARCSRRNLRNAVRVRGSSRKSPRTNCSHYPEGDSSDDRRSWRRCVAAVRSTASALPTASAVGSREVVGGHRNLPTDGPCFWQRGGQLLER